MSIRNRLTAGLHTTAGIALLYATLAALWIVLSSYWLTITVTDPLLQSRIELAKGLAFVAATSVLLYLLLNHWHGSRALPPSAMQIERSAPPGTIRLVLVFMALASLVPLVDFVIYEFEVPQIERAAYDNLTSIAQLKESEIENWLYERNGDAQALAADSEFAKQVGELMQQRHHDPELSKQIGDELDLMRTKHRFDSVMLLDAGGRILSAKGGDTDISPLPMEQMHQSLLSENVLFIDLYRNAAGKIHIDWIVPVITSDRNGKHAAAAVVLRAMPEKFVYPLILSWPTASKSGESYLVRRQGDSIQYLSRLRKQEGMPLVLHGSMDAPSHPSVIAIRENAPGVTSGIDINQTPVLAAYRPVSGTDWYLVAKIDRAEVMMPLLSMIYWISLITSVAVLLVMAVILMLYRQQQRSHQLALLARSAASLRESNELLRLFIEHAPAALAMFDRDMRYLTVSHRWLSDYGLQEHQIIGRSHYEVFPEIPARWKALHAQALAGEVLRSDEDRFERADGSVQWLKWEIWPWKTKEGDIGGILIFTEDISIQKQMTAALDQNVARLRTLVQTIPDLVWLKNEEGIFLSCNPAFERLYGAGEADIVGKTDYDFVDKQLADFFRELDLKAMADDKPTTNEEWLTFAGNGYRGLFETIKAPLKDTDGNPIGVLGIARDITKRKLAEESLLKLSQAVEQSSSTIVITDLNAKIEYANAAFVKESGYSLEEAIGKNPKLLHSGKTPKSTYDDMWAHLANGKPWEGEFINRRKDGSEYFESALISPVFQPDGRMTNYLAVKENISVRKAADAKIQRLTQLYATLSQCNQAIVRCTSEQELFDNICQVAVRFGGMKMAWIGLVDEASKQIRPVAKNGTGTDYLEGIQISSSPDDPSGRGAAGTSIRENRPVWIQDYQQDPIMAPWLERGKSFGWHSVASLPLSRNGIPVGCITLYSDTVDAFNEDARRLLMEMATDISFALDNFDHAEQRRKSKQELLDSEQRFRGLVEQSLAGIYIIQDSKCVYVNPRAAEILGQNSADDLIGCDPLSVVAAADRNRAAEALRMLLERERDSIALEFPSVLKDGTEIMVGANASYALYHGQPAVIGLIQDISVKKRDEARILKYVEQLKTTFLSTVQLATSLSEMRDPYTAGHERRVSDIAVAIATEMGLDEQQVEGIKVAGYLHDIGKISIPAEILVKPGRLNATEYALVQGHAQASYDVLKIVPFPWPVATIALQHHERMDGSGYPNGLKGDEILLESRIMAVADVVEAMASHRPYRPGLGIDAALAEIERGRGTIYDADVADSCLRLFREKGYQLPPH